MKLDAKRKLAKRLRDLLEEDKQREAAKRIERASSEILGEEHFAYDQHNGVAQILARVDRGKLQEFISSLYAIRLDLDLEYEAAAKKLLKGEDNENT